ncbi:MAG: hypothetical protein Tsb0020_17410 [Haliangiales bacterium]
MSPPVAADRAARGDWLSYLDRGGMLLGLGYALASAVMSVAGWTRSAPWLIPALALASVVVAAVAAGAGWRRHRRRWMLLAFLVSASLVAASAALGVASWPGLVMAVVGGIAVTLAHDGDRVLCERARPPAVPISILTGFLGSGKTTVLNHVLRDPSMARTAVIINEFGDIGLDHLLVEKVDERMMRLSSGCLCCTVRGDLLTTLHELFTRVERGAVPEIERVLVETTGLADPAPILHALMASPAALRYCRLDTVTATVDAVNGASTLAQHPEAVKQVAVADRLLLSKLDLVASGEPSDRLAALRAQLRQLNPAAPIIEVTHGQISPAEFFGDSRRKLHERSFDVDAWLDEAAYRADRAGSDGSGEGEGHSHSHGDDDHRHGDDDHRHGSAIDAYCITRDAPIHSDAFQSFIELLTEAHGDDLLRVKGILCLRDKADTPAIIHGVQHVFHPVRWLPTWPSDDRRSRIVFITRGVPRARIDRLLSVLDRAPERRRQRGVERAG